MDADFARRLRQLGVVKGLSKESPLRTRSQPEAPDLVAPGTPADLLATPGDLPGAPLATETGVIWVVQETYAADYCHGRYPLAELSHLAALLALSWPEVGARPAFLDTETTGLAGGAGTLAFLIGVGVWEEHQLTLHQLFLRTPAEEAAALHHLNALLAQATGLVTFNGLGFDAPLLETRHILNRIPPRWSGLPHLDLLPVARLLWRDHLPSRRLGALETEVLGIQRSEEDLPSAWIPWLYRQYLQEGKTGPMRRVIYHNAIDILSMVTLAAHVGKLVEGPAEAAAGEWAGLGRLYDRAGQEERAFMAWREALSGARGELLPESAGRLWQEMGARYKRRAAWSEALAVWEAWSRSDPWCIEPLVEQAKYYEWEMHAAESALALTEQALQRARTSPAAPALLVQQAELEHRCKRLRRKIQCQA